MIGTENIDHKCTTSCLGLQVGIWQLVAGAEVISPLLISVLWAVHSAIPPTLLLYYSLLGHGFDFRILCK